jgi:preprotein translocase subunit YajC
MLISPAYAQAAGGGGEAGLVSLLPLVLIFVVFYFLLIRPQQKKMKAHRAMVEALRRGDRVVTGGGIIGSVTKVLSDNEVQIEVADGVRLRVVKHTIQEVLSKTEPADKGGQSGQKAANDEGGDGGSGGSAGGASGRGFGGGGFGLSKLLGGGKKSGS